MCSNLVLCWPGSHALSGEGDGGLWPPAKGSCSSR